MEFGAPVDCDLVTLFIIHRATSNFDAPSFTLSLCLYYLLAAAEKHLGLLSVAPWVVLPLPSIAISLYFFEYSANTFIQFRNRFSGIPSVGSSAHRLIHQWYLGRWIVGGGGGSGMG